MSALRNRGYQAYITTYMLAMMADNIEHVISYWVAFQKFHSPALGGFAVVSHWLPFLVFAVPVGALNDRSDSRRIVQVGMVLFICASLGWGYFFISDTLTIPWAMALLVLHGCAGVLWSSSNVLLHDIVGKEGLPSAVRLNATGRYLAILVGPALGSAMLLWLGPITGIFVNTVFYLPLVIWLIRAPYGTNKTATSTKGFKEIARTIGEVRTMPVVAVMIVLAGAASFFIGNAYHAQMPGFATDLGRADPGVAYTALLGADAAGALIAGIVLEARGGLLKTTPRNAMLLALLWGAALGSFALVREYYFALPVLFCAGFFELSFSSMAQTIVQLNTQNETRGRVLGLFTMSAMGLRTFSGVTVGLMGSQFGIHASLAGSAAAFVLFVSVLRWKSASVHTSPPPPLR